MCGIAGIYNHTAPGYGPGAVKAMLATLTHRGPDDGGIWSDGDICLGHRRLSIIGISTGHQPLSNASGDVWVSANGEIFNYIELRAGLKAKGHIFHTDCDIELIPHLYDEYGLEMFAHMNGQFAFALWDTRRKRLVLARDRYGIAPLFYARHKGALAFASEVKALIPIIGKLNLDLKGLCQVFTFWNSVAPRTVYEGVSQLRPGECLVVDASGLKSFLYWDLTFPKAGWHNIHDEHRAASGIREILDDAVRIRLRADVPVGSYLSGGLDSSILALLVKKHAYRMHTFSVSFADKTYDEAPFQETMGAALGTIHHVRRIAYRDIGDVFPAVVRHMETPVLRSAPAPMYLLSDLARDHGITVVLTGEGADELFGGYDIFKEAKVRRFWAAHPASTLRPQLLFRLYPYSPVQMKRSGKMLMSFYRRDLLATEHFGYSHLPTWRNTAGIQTLFAPEIREALAGYRPEEELEGLMPKDYSTWHLLNQAQYLEIKLLLAGYLLCSQGERMTMAHSVEGRYPFLDHRLAEFAGGIAPGLKLKGLKEKYILRQAFRDELPREIFTRVKQPYGAPNKEGFFFQGEPKPDVAPFLEHAAITDGGIFDARMVDDLVKKCAHSSRLGFRDGSAFMGVLSTQMVIEAFCR